MSRGLSDVSVDDLDEALRLYRRLLRNLVLILVLGMLGVVALGYLSRAVWPPYGLYIFGWDLVTIGLLVLLAVLFLEVRRTGRAIGGALNEPSLEASPITAVTSGLSVIAERANTMGMEWSGFLGPLQPVRPR